MIKDNIKISVSNSDKINNILYKNKNLKICGKDTDKEMLFFILYSKSDILIAKNFLIALCEFIIEDKNFIGMYKDNISYHCNYILHDLCDTYESTVVVMYMGLCNYEYIKCYNLFDIFGFHSELIDYVVDYPNYEEMNNTNVYENEKKETIFTNTVKEVSKMFYRDIQLYERR